MKNYTIFKEIDKIFESDKMKVNSPAKLKEVLQKFSFNVEDFKDDLLYPETNPYGRSLLYQSPNFEALLMNWKPKNESNIHSHGESYGCVIVLKGQVINNYYDDNTKIKQISIHAPGDYTEVPVGIYHQIKNNTNDYSVTLHFYTPPLKDMKVLDSTDLAKRYIVKCNCGAWNPKPKDIKEIIHKE
jgi:predicted metal-dependent enzyme (double-stranded beta helix superfamily)